MHPDGRSYVDRYKVDSFPHIAIIDPRTGRLLWSRSGWTLEDPVTPTSFAQDAMDFCSRNSFDRPPQAPKPGGTKPQKKPVQDMSEEEQLRAAMQESLKSSSQPEEEEDADAEIVEDDSEVEIVDDAKPAAVEEAKPPSLIDRLLSIKVGEEDPSGSRLQLKMPDGKRAVRRFAPSDTVQKIFAYFAVSSFRLVCGRSNNCPIQQNNDEARGGKEFLLMAGYPMRDLSQEMDSTIEQSQLKNEAVTIRWK